MTKRSQLYLASHRPVCCGRCAGAGRYPSQNIRFVVPFTAGSATDTLARLLANRMSTTLGRSVFVENIAGGSGIPAAQNVVRSAPDGYTVMVTANTTHAGNQALLKKVPYDAVADFETVTKLGTITLALVANPSVPANDVKRADRLCQGQPGQAYFRRRFDVITHVRRASQDDGWHRHVARPLQEQSAGRD